MKKLILTILIILFLCNSVFAITIRQGESVSKNQCLIYLVTIQNNRAYFQVTLPSMQIEKFIMAGGNRRQFEIDDKEYFFDLLNLSEDKAVFNITEKK